MKLHLLNCLLLLYPAFVICGDVAKEDEKTAASNLHIVKVKSEESNPNHHYTSSSGSGSDEQIIRIIHEEQAPTALYQAPQPVLLNEPQPLADHHHHPHQHQYHEQENVIKLVDSGPSTILHPLPNPETKHQQPQTIFRLIKQHDVHDQQHILPQYATQHHQSEKIIKFIREDNIAPVQQLYQQPLSHDHHYAPGHYAGQIIQPITEIYHQTPALQPIYQFNPIFPIQHHQYQHIKTPHHPVLNQNHQVFRVIHLVTPSVVHHSNSHHYDHPQKLIKIFKIIHPAPNVDYTHYKNPFAHNHENHHNHHEHHNHHNHEQERVKIIKVVHEPVNYPNERNNGW